MLLPRLIKNKIIFKSKTRIFFLIRCFYFYDFFIYCVKGGPKQVVILIKEFCFNISFSCCVSSSTATVVMTDKTSIAFISYVAIRSLCLL